LKFGSQGSFPELESALTAFLKVTASDILPNQQIASKDGKIFLLGKNLVPFVKSLVTIDAQRAYVTPGGVDSHVHLAQDNSPTGDTFETGTRSAICGGTTTVLPFASQKRHEESLVPVVEEYHRRANGKAYCDYGFHLILTNPTDKILNEELPVLVKDGGIGSVKLYMTYDPMKLSDRQMLDVMLATRALGMTTMVHAENADIIGWISDQLQKQKITDAFSHALSRPNIAEDEATYRAISLAEVMDVPILIVHMSSWVAAEHVRKAQTRLLPVHAETCPHYLYLQSDKLKAENFEGAKGVCSPPLRDSPTDLDAMWQGLANGTFTTVSSDHAAHKFDHGRGKKAGLVDGVPQFRKIPNGLPGLETRLPLLFEGVLDGKISITKFVELTSVNPAKLYGLADTKGTIAPGYDADLTIWYPTSEQNGDGMAECRPFRLANEMLHHDVDYTPFEGFRFRNWPRYTVLRGKVVWDRDNGGLKGNIGFGQFLKRGRSTLSRPRDVWVNEFRPI